jgi:pyrroline-5-carboxylate reductase
VSDRGETLDELLLVGCGKMGGALLRGWRQERAARRFLVVEPAAVEFAGAPDVQVHPTADRLGPGVRPQVVVFAVKPQAMGQVAPDYRRFAVPGTVFLSIAAGKTLDYFARLLGPDASIVRAMPNTPASIRRGITVACANSKVAAAQRRICDRLLAAVGEVAWIDDEALIDAVTAVSGSGPAYVFFLIECLARAGARAGLPEELPALFEEAVAAATRRSRELAE